MTKMKVVEEIGEKSTFERFVGMVAQRDHLYDDFIGIDELDEIGTHWITFSKECVQSLTSMLALTETLSKRFNKEYLVLDPAVPAEMEQKANLGEKLQKQVELLFQGSLLLYVYSSIRNKGVFGVKTPDYSSEGYIRSKEILDDITDLFIQETGYSLAGIRSLMSHLVKLEQKKRLIPYLKKEKVKVESAELPEEVRIELGNYDRMQGIFLMEQLVPFMGDISKKWWWEDPISLYYVASHALEHFESAITHWEKQAGELAIQSIVIDEMLKPKVEIQKNDSLSEHYYRIAMVALEKADFESAYSYLSQGAELHEKSIKLLEAFPSFKEKARKIHFAKEKALRLTLLSKTTKLTLIYNKLCASITSGEEITAKDITKLTKLAEETLEYSKIPYIGSIPIVFEVIGQYLSTELKAGKLSRKTIKETDKRLKRVEVLLDNASKAEIRSIELLDDSNVKGSELRTVMRRIIEQTQILAEAVIVLPKGLKNRLNIYSRSKAVIHYCETEILITYTYNLFSINPVLDLMLIAKAMYTVNKSVVYTGEASVDGIESFCKYVKELQAELLLKGNLVEMSILTNILDYHYAAIMPILDSIVERNKMWIERGELEELIPSVESDVEKLESFLMLLDRIGENVETIQQYRDEELVIDEQKVNWPIIDRRKEMLNGTKKYITAIILGLKGYFSWIAKKKTDAAELFDKAQKEAYEASEEFAKIKDKLDGEISGLPEIVFNFGQFLGSSYSKVRDNLKLDDYPMEDALGIFQLIVDNI
ncbi:MAG: hypothetical protein ACTSYA_09250 [Candidatus Kariarchaeaceae archaeon]